MSVHPSRRIPRRRRRRRPQAQRRERSRRQSSTTGRRRSWPAVWTSNRCKANPVLWSEQVVKDGHARVVVANSGGANCYTGPRGFQVTHATAESAAELAGCGALDVGRVLDRS